MYKNMPLSEYNTSDQKYRDLAISLIAAQLNNSMSTEDLAAKVGTTPEHLDAIKMDREIPTLDLLIKICVVLNAHLVITTAKSY